MIGLRTLILLGHPLLLRNSTRRCWLRCWNKTKRRCTKERSRAMADLIFSFQEMLGEIQAMSRIGTEFLTAETQQITIPNLVAVLESIRVARPQASRPWSIEIERPLRTIDSAGEYEHAGRRGAHIIFGELTFIWEVLCPQEPGPRSRPQKNFVDRKSVV